MTLKALVVGIVGDDLPVSTTFRQIVELPEGTPIFIGLKITFYLDSGVPISGSVYEVKANVSEELIELQLRDVEFE